MIKVKRKFTDITGETKNDMLEFPDWYAAKRFVNSIFEMKDDDPYANHKICIYEETDFGNGEKTVCLRTKERSIVYQLKTIPDA